MKSLLTKMKRIVAASTVVLMALALLPHQAFAASPLVTVSIDSLITNNTTPTLTGTVSDPSASLTLVVDGSSYTPISDVSGNWSGDVTGALADGEYGTAVVATTLGGSVVTATGKLIVDTLAPTLSSVSISSSNVQPTWAKIGNKISLTFTADEPVQVPTVTIAGNSAVVTPNIAGQNTYTATYEMASTDAEGVVTFGINFSDIAGTAGALVAATTDGTSVIFDKTAPVISDDSKSVVADSGIYITEASGTADLITKWSVPVKNLDGTYTYQTTYRATDAAGNVSVDFVKPTKLIDPALALKPVANATVNDLLGEKIKPVHAELGLVYEDAGTHLEWADTNNPVLVWTEGTLNTSIANKIGENYSLTYQAAEFSGYATLNLKMGLSNYVKTRMINVSDTTGPSAVTNFAVTAGNGFVKLSWTNPTDPDFAQVQIYRSLTPGGVARKIHFTASKTTNSFEDTDVVNGTTYYYYLVALDNASNPSLPSPQLSATPAAPKLASADMTFGSDDYVAPAEVVKTTTDNSVKGSTDSGDKNNKKVAWYNKEIAGMELWLWIIVLIFVLGFGYWYFTRDDNSPKPKPKAKTKSKK